MPTLGEFNRTKKIDIPSYCQGKKENWAWARVKVDISTEVFEEIEAMQKEEGKGTEQLNRMVEIFKDHIIQEWNLEKKGKVAELTEENIKKGLSWPGDFFAIFKVIRESGQGLNIEEKKS
jgi:hypothetical protein